MALSVLLACGLASATAQAAAAAAEDPGRTDAVAPGPSFTTGVPHGWLTILGMSDDGRMVLFDPHQANFAQYPGQAIFVRDMEGGYYAISTSPDGTAINGFVSSAVISGNGDVVAFTSNATDAATGAAGRNLYIARLSSGTVALVSHLPGTTRASNNVEAPLQITPDGRFVVFGARSPRLDGGPPATTGAIQLYRHDVVAGTATAITVTDDNTSLAAADSGEASISADGSHVAFTSTSGDLVAPHVPGGALNVYVRNLTAGTTTLVSHGAGSTERTGGVREPTISSDGTTVAFLSNRTTALTGVVTSDVFSQVVAWSAATGLNRLVSRSATSGAANNFSASPRVNSDGSIIAFLTAGTDLVAGVVDTNNPPPGPPPPLGTVYTDAYAEVGGSLRLLSRAAASPTQTGNRGVDRLVLSRNGNRAAFSTVATDLVAGLTDPGFGADGYAADTATATVRAASLEGRSSRLLDGDNAPVSITPDGGELAFTQIANFNGQLTSLPRRRAFGPTLPPVPPTPAPVGTATEPSPLPVLFSPLSPIRILDSRTGVPKAGAYDTPWGADTTRTVTVAGTVGVPADASAVVLNATVTNTTSEGYLTVWPTGTAQPLASNLNWAAGQTVPNAVTVKLGNGGQLSLYNATGSADVILDLVGYYSPGGAGYTSLVPVRVQDSRPPGPQVGPYGSPWPAGQARSVAVAGVAGVPADADAVLVNATVTNASQGGYLTVWPAGEPRPLASSLNWAPGETVANAITVKVGTGGKVEVFNATGTVDVIFDVVGSFRAGSGFAFHPTVPARIQDSRFNGPHVGAWGPGSAFPVTVANHGRVPEGATDALLNLTATGTTASSYATVWPDDEAMPLASSLNWDPGRTRANAVTTKIGRSGGVVVSNAAGSTHIIADVAGWYG